MDYQARAATWRENIVDEQLSLELDELLASEDSSLLEDAFFQDLQFGTAGLRGVIGVGTNRMNAYTVGRATQGLAQYILETSESEVPSVAIARDSRHKGEEFVARAASVLAANGIHVFVFPRIEPTPALSFAVRDLICDAGICMTASHNPKEYNGYKVYGPDGCQITSTAAGAISAAIAKTDPFTQVKSFDFDTALENGLIEWISDDTLDRFMDAVMACSIASDADANQDLSVVYTPLCGTGLECMERMFAAIGIDDVSLVEAQAQPSGDFPTCPYPNPETREALQEGIALCEKTGADILLATDPDADRVGVAVAHNHAHELLTGNEIGILLFDYICSQRLAHNTMPANPIAVSTIVSTSMIDALAAEYGVEVMRVLTGFKYIGDIITGLETKEEQGRFILGFEESYGYLTGAHVRDKDAINASLLICEMARFYKAQGIDLIDALEALYERYGYYANRTVSLSFPGASGSAQMKELMANLRTAPIEALGRFTVVERIDYQPGIKGLPAADVVEFVLEDGAKIIFRPSGTEPKVKLYLFARGQSRQNAQELLDELESAARSYV